MEKDMSGTLNAVALMLTYVLSKEAAQTLSPYIFIILASCFGAFISLSRGESLIAWDAVKYVLFRIMVACVLAIPIAETVQAFLPLTKIHSSMCLLAFAIGAISDFRKLRAWFIGIFKTKVEKDVGKEGAPK